MCPFAAVVNFCDHSCFVNFFERETNFQSWHMFLSIVESKYSTRKKSSAQRLFQGDKMYVHLQSNLTPINDQLGE